MGQSRSGLQRSPDVHVASIPASLAAHIRLELGAKPVARELHAPDELASAAARWRERGFEAVAGAPVREDARAAAMVTDQDTAHTVRPLATHPVVERLLELGGPIARRVLLDAKSPVYRALCDWLQADQAPATPSAPTSDHVRARQALYVARDRKQAERARTLDRMAADDAPADATRELGALLGYPPCCTEAFAALDRRWPNRRPIAAAMRRTSRYEPRLNNLSLVRFAWIEHFPCRYDCPASLELADLAAAHLAERNAPLAAALDALLAVPRVYRADDHQAVLVGASLAAPGRVRFERLVPLARWWAAPRPIDERSGGWDGLANRREVDAGDPGAAALVLPFGL